MIHDAEILLVEDNEDDAALAIRTLRKRNIAGQVHHVTDGEQALDFVFRTGASAGRPPGPPPRVILLDLKLPKLDGLEVLRRLKADERTRTIPVTVFTSSAENRDLEAAWKLGANSYIVKPLDIDKFSHAVAQLGIYWGELNEPLKT